MSQRAFIVKINLDDSLDEQAVAEDITDALLADGYQVISVAPWKTQDEQVSMIASLGLTSSNPDDTGLGIPNINL